MLNYELKSLLDKLAEAIVGYLDLEYPINNAKDIVEQLGGKIRYDTSMSEFAEAIGVKTKDGFEIRVSPNKTDERTTYEVILELCEMILFMGLLVNKEMWSNQPYNTEYKNKYTEYECTRHLAQSILMPEYEFTVEIYKNTINNSVNTKNVAKKFGVPIDIARSRALELYLIEW